jgi:hypothetical protein
VQVVEEVVDGREKWWRRLGWRRGYRRLIEQRITMGGGGGTMSS